MEIAINFYFLDGSKICLTVAENIKIKDIKKYIQKSIEYDNSNDKPSYVNFISISNER